ncbi:hypothetical protein [uncultured Prevotella sp.]|uniref:hypothetical protein n=1 Tax=uncultured Prevotella sp. TaxID=159272 RepID=UPI0025D78FE8|nr:hypothetical protein [uncultured Prevotella sp.]
MNDKAKVLIAYNDDISEPSRQFFYDCATDIRNHCIQKDVYYQTIAPSKLTETNIMAAVYDSNICYIAAHGTKCSIINEQEEDIISTHTTNYNFNGKSLFAVSCYCAQILKDELMKIGLKLFVGYNSSFTEFPGYEEFYTSANSGLKAFVEGASVDEMRKIMNGIYDECYKSLEVKNPLAADALFDNREALVIAGEGNLHLSDLL